ncbi:MAG: GntP family permease [Verrucomicrobiales bacterium]|nr:GntP family permease [Verrucomicrobiales bacterium]
MSPFVLLSLGMLIVVISILVFRWHPFVALITAALTVAFLTPESLLIDAQLTSEAKEWFAANPSETATDAPAPFLKERLLAEEKATTWFVSRVTGAFGKACGGIALVIAMAAIIGKCLLDSGGARRIVDSLMRVCGLRGTPFAFAVSSFTLGIPVFFDTVFYLLMPLGKALRRKTGKDYLLYILTIVAGATMAHSLVPPTPGPLTVAGFFGDEVSIGSMMLGGFVVGLFTVSTGIAYAYWANRRWEIPLRESESDVEQGIEEGDEAALPSLFLSLLPILLPVVLIGGQTITTSLGVNSGVLKFLGDKNIALILSAAVAVFLLISSRYRKNRETTRAAIQSALASGGVIILVTAAGSGFGAVLKDTGIAGEIGGLFSGGSSLMLIPISYLITALVRTAQGSATVAMITAGGMIGPLAIGADLGYSALYLALAIGCGSKPISWANDSGFWVIGRMSGMTPMETFKSVSVMMILMSLVGLGVVLLGASLFPLV